MTRSAYRTWDANPGIASHVEAVTNVRLLLERGLRLGVWECERELARRIASDGGRRSHLPDAALTCPQRVAIEVELTLKNRGRLREIMDELSLGYDEVWYFAPLRLRRTLTKLAGEAPFGNIRVFGYPALAAEVARAAPLLNRA